MNEEENEVFTFFIERLRLAFATSQQLDSIRIWRYVVDSLCSAWEA